MSKVSLQTADADVALERRRSMRAELIVRVDYSTVDELFSEFTRDINEGGLFIETEKPRPVGTEVALEFNLPGSDEVIATTGMVVRVTGPEEGGVPGMGIEFDHLTPEDRTHINGLIRTLRSAPGE